MTATARCRDCGARFERDADESWKTRCLRCWIETKKGEAPPPAADPILGELAQHLRALLMLTHPDGHGNSTLSNKVTAWLLAVRNRLEHNEPVS